MWTVALALTLSPLRSCTSKNSDEKKVCRQVVGNIVSEWVQVAGLVFLTKRLVEIGSKESK